MGQLLRRLVAIAITVPLLVVGLFAWRFWRLPLSQDSGDWARFGEYVGGSLGTFFGLLAFVGVLLTIREQRSQARRDAHASRTAARAAREANAISRSAYLSEQRPWVKLSTSLTSLRGGPLIYDRDGWRVVLSYAIENLGKTPARRTAFSARVIPFLLSHQPTPGGPFVPATDVAAELRRFTQDSSGETAGLIGGALLFPGEDRPAAVYQVYCNDPVFVERLASPAYSGQLVVLACASYQSTIDESLHVTANAFALFLNQNPDNPAMSTRIELTDGRFDLAGRSYGFQYHPSADSYAT